MIRTLALLAALLVSCAARAQEPAKPEPTVTLTAIEIEALVNAEINKRLAAPVYAKIQAAFTPPRPPPPVPASSVKEPPTP